jgi:hypothetical protein
VKYLLLTLAAALLLLSALEAQQRPRVLYEQRLGTGRITEFGPWGLRGRGIREPAPFGRLLITEWRENAEVDGRWARHAFRDQDGNWWRLAYQGKGEGFVAAPPALDGWRMKTEGCWRFVTVGGSFFLGSEGLNRPDRAFIRAPAAAPGKALREPAPFGRLAIAEWKENADWDGRPVRYAFRDPENNWWYLGYQSRSEGLGGAPSSLEGWPTKTEAGWAFTTFGGSFFVGPDKDSLGKAFTRVLP